MIEIIPARAEDITTFFGRTTPYTLRNTWVAKLGSELLAVFGVTIQQGRRYIFSEIREEALKYRKRILSTAKKFIANLPKGIYYAVADDRRNGATRFLLHLGFEPDFNLYRIEVR